MRKTATMATVSAVSSKTANLVAHHFDTVDFAHLTIQGNLENNVPMRKIIILDVSGSMGDFATQLVKNVFPSILHPEEEIDLILFTCTQRHYVMKAGDMSKVSFSQGGTYMSDVPSMVVDLIMKHKMVKIVIVTDGEVCDQNEVFANAMNLKASIPASAVVQVLPIRFINSSYANPDTKAVMSVGMMSTETVEPQDVDKISFSDIGVLSQTFFEDKYQVATLRADIPCLCRLPGDIPSKEIKVKSNDHILLQSQGHLLESLGLVIQDGEDVISLTIQRNEIQNEGNIHEYLMLLNNRTRINAVMGIDSQFIFDMVDKLNTYVTLRAGVEDGVQPVKPSTHQRLQLIKRRIDRTSKSLLHSISQLKNMDAVNAFNSQQMASFLRHDDTSRASKGLAKRQDRVYGGVGIDFEIVAKKELKSFVKVLHDHSELFESGELITSFYSMETMGDMCKTLVSLSESDIDALALEDILLLVGSVGLPITSQTRTLVDPWIFRIDQVHVDCFLSQQDWCAARMQSNGNLLNTPGTQKRITGVIPFAFSVEDVSMMNLYHNHVPSLSRMQGSVAMMGMVSDLPNSDLVLQASALLSMAERIDLSTCTSREFQIMKKLLEDIQTRTRNTKYFDELRSNLKPEYFTGDNDITGVLKPLVVWLENPNTDLIPELIRLETRWRVKSRAKMLGLSGDSILSDWLQLTPNHCQPLQPLFVPEPADVKFFDVVDVERIISLVKNWITWNPRALYSLYELSRCDSVESFTLRLQHDLSDMWMAYLAVETFHHPKIVDKETSKLIFPLLKQDEEINQYWKSIIRDYFANEYKNALTNKSKQEKDIIRSQHLEQLSTTSDLAEFLKLLHANFSPRDSDILPILVQSNCVEPLIKIWLFVTGKYPNSSEAVWNDGNVRRLVRKEWNEVQLVFNATEPGQKMWTSFLEILKNSSHTYRNGPPNRHGYSMDCPSYWALGFESPDAMHAAYGAQKWAEYLTLCQEHNVVKEYLK